MTSIYQKCKEDGACFAKQHNRCQILNDPKVYGKGTCPFQKPEREVTNGRFYPYNPPKWS